LGLTQAQFADKIGAASKAVVYQWESKKRKPSPVFWQRIEELEKTSIAARRHVRI
jgi:transcriptional regulator with XRE-family HTH domain